MENCVAEDVNVGFGFHSLELQGKYVGLQNHLQSKAKVMAVQISP